MYSGGLPCLPTRSGFKLLLRVQNRVARDCLNERPPLALAGIADDVFWTIQALVYVARPHFPSCR
jgi:hypothetical protein